MDSADWAATATPRTACFSLKTATCEVATTGDSRVAESDSLGTISAGGSSRGDVGTELGLEEAGSTALLSEPGTPPVEELAAPVAEPTVVPDEALTDFSVLL